MAIKADQYSAYGGPTHCGVSEAINLTIKTGWTVQNVS